MLGSRTSFGGAAAANSEASLISKELLPCDTAYLLAAYLRTSGSTSMTGGFHRYGQGAPAHS